MQYLATSEYENYGLEATTPEALVASASSIIDSLCRRPSLGITQYTERIRIAPESGRGRLTYLPLCGATADALPVVKVRVRYQASDVSTEAALAHQIAQVFGFAGAGVEVDPQQVEIVMTTGEITLPPQALGLGYIEAEVTYTAGFDSVPDAVKFACAQLVRNAQAAPALNVRSSGLDRMQLDYFSASLADDTVKRLLGPYVAVRCGA